MRGITGEGINREKGIRAREMYSGRMWFDSYYEINAAGNAHFKLVYLLQNDSPVLQIKRLSSTVIAWSHD